MGRTGDVFRVPDEYKAKNFRLATYIMGGTMERFWHRPDLEPDGARGANSRFFLVYKPPDSVMQGRLGVRGGCDGCPYQHKPGNLGCSANQPNTESPIREPGVLYNFLTKRPLTVKFQQVNEVLHGGKVRGVTLIFSGRM